MKTAITKFFHTSSDHGLMLVDSPTGSGKTYSVREFLKEALKDSYYEGKKFFFITNLKKNLGIEEFKEAVGNDELLFLVPNTEGVVENFNKIIESIPAELDRDGFVGELDTCLTCYNSITNQKAKDSYLKKQVVNAESEFRDKLRSHLKQKFPTLADRKKAVFGGEYSWVAEIYPSVYFSERRVILMSVDKFVMTIDPIIDAPFQLPSSNHLDGNYVFIDEFDQSKKILLNRIIAANATDRQIDLISLFHTIYNSLGKPKQEKLFEFAQSWKNQKTSLRVIVDQFKRKADDIYRKYFLEYDYKIVEEDLQDGNVVLFHDDTTITCSDAEDKYIHATFNEVQKVNDIQLKDDKPNDNANNMSSLIQEIKSYLSYFCNGVNLLATNYLYRQNERHKEISREDAISSVLHCFEVKERYHIKYITNIVSLSPIVSSKQMDWDNSFFRKGFTFFSIKDEKNHDLQSIVRMAAFSTTPEWLLYNIALRAKVIGISATASVESVLGNYYLPYIKNKLKDAYYEMDNEDLNRIRNEFDQRNVGFKDGRVKVNCQAYKSTFFKEKGWETLFANEEYAAIALNKVRNTLGDNSFETERVFKICWALEHFLTKDDIHSFLCMLNYSIKDNIAELINELFKMLKKDHELPENLGMIEYIYSDNYESKKKNIKERLSKGDKIFVVSTYNSIGAGQNMQYELPSSDLVKVVKVADCKWGNHEKDFDAIYLDGITNLFPNIVGRKIGEADLCKSLFYLEYLQEVGEISVNDAHQYIKQAFKGLDGMPCARNLDKIRSTKGYRYYYTILIIQAMGRLCRTLHKSPNIYIFYDAEIAKYIDQSVDDGKRLLNYEFKAFLQSCAELESLPINEFEEQLRNKAEIISCRTNKMIQDFLRYPWNEAKMSRWAYMRDFALKHPTVADPTEPLVVNTYVELPKQGVGYSYVQRDDYSRVNVYFESIPTPLDSEVRYVSEESSRLPLVMKVHFIREYFEKHGYATSFPPCQYMMSPTFFNNIYKGALGEAVGRCVFEHFNIPLVEIETPDLFEKFDFRVKDTSVFVDFKNWHPISGSLYEDDYDDYMNHIEEKAESCGASSILVINMVDDGSFRSLYKLLGSFHLYELPSLIISNEQGVQVNDKVISKIKEIINNSKKDVNG